jgi:hypothetical protein
MKGKLIVLSLVLLGVLAASAVAGAKVTPAQKAVAPEAVTSQAAHDYTPSSIITPSRVTTGILGGTATIIGTTSYDYMWNSGSPTHIVYYNGISYMIYVGRDDPAVDPREIRYVSYDGTTFLAPEAAIPGATQSTYFSGIDVFRGGLADGFAGIAAGWAVPGNSYYCLESAAGQGNFAQTSVTPNRDTQTLTLDENGTVLFEDSNNRTDYRFLISADFGTNWNEVNPGVTGTTTLPGAQIQSALEPPILLAPNGDVVMVTTLIGPGGEIPPVGTSTEDDADMWGYFTSTDQGSTWTWTTIGVDGDDFLPGYFNLVENFGQIGAVLDNNGNVHSVANGYSLRADPDTSLFTMDVIYWDATNGFKSLVNFDRDWDIINNEVLARQSANTNMFGCAYPSISISDDGQVIVCVWSQPNFTETTIDTAFNGLMWHDIWWNASFDGGATWNGAVQLTATTDRDESFLSLSHNLEDLGGGDYMVRALYIADDEPGQCPFAGTCTQVDVTYHEFIVNDTDVREDLTNVPDQYLLGQNYPNPFNPTTKINFSLPEKSELNLSVFNVLGEKVATLVEGTKEAGTYTADFIGANLPSGVYYYTLTTNEFTSTKKMMLIK